VFCTEIFLLTEYFCSRIFLLTAQDAAVPWQQATGIAAAAAELEVESQDAIVGDADGEVNLVYPDIILHPLSFVVP
jgi:hypothetical protein